MHRAAAMMATPIHLTGELLAGARIAGRYTLVRPLGSGGMGAVWAARNDVTDAEVALKFLLRPGERNEEVRERFRREAYATARLSHRAIVRIYDLLDLSPEGDGVALVMELLHGRTLAAHLCHCRKLPVEETTAIALPVLSGLAHAHAAGIVHRDLKPENIFLAEDPDGVVTPKILDFGISKVRSPDAPALTRDGEMIGTPSYMSPEQARGRGGIDARSDLFNVGIVLYELLSGANPFSDGGNGGLHAVVASILEHDPPPIEDVPPQVWRVIERALRKPQGERFRSACELASALRLATGMGATTSLPSEMQGSLGEVRLSFTPPALLSTTARDQVPDRHSCKRRSRSGTTAAGLPARDCDRFRTRISREALRHGHAKRTSPRRRQFVPLLRFDRKKLATCSRTSRSRVGVGAARAPFSRRWPLVLRAAGAVGGAALIAAVLATWIAESSDPPRAPEAAAVATARTPDPAPNLARETASMAASAPAARADIVEVPTVPRVRPVQTTPAPGVSSTRSVRPPRHRKGIARDPGF
jgi:eukaryotic-like serine/threonine-protein kinase